MMTHIQHLFDLSGRIAVVTGGAGVLGSAMAKMLAAHGVRVAILDLDGERAQALADELNRSSSIPLAMGLAANVLERESIAAAATCISAEWGPVDLLINGAGGNKAQATTSADRPFFDIPPEAAQWVFNLNVLGTWLPCQIFGEIMARHGQGAILNIVSMNAFRPLTRIPAYSAAKAAVSNFTQWLAVYMAQEYTPEIRVNALAPGFFLTEQNRFLLIDENSGQLTDRGQQILDHTPAGRFGNPEDLLGATLWLLSPAASFVTGAVIPVDGGFNAYSGV